MLVTTSELVPFWYYTIILFLVFNHFKKGKVFRVCVFFFFLNSLALHFKIILLTLTRKVLSRVISSM